jgi:hypothetical protein
MKYAQRPLASQGVQLNPSVLVGQALQKLGVISQRIG